MHKLPIMMEINMAISTDQLKQIIADQQEKLILPEPYIKRESEDQLSRLANNQEVIVITGIRRAGKSTLLQHLRKNRTEQDFYFNFEDERLVTFTSDDFQTLQMTFIELFGVQKTYYFDEIQNIPNWELFVRRLYNEGNKIFITGSNANLLSEELGTRLTGRYISLTTYPLSFNEFLQYKTPLLSNLKLLSTTKKAEIKKVFNEYYMQGGFPAYIQNQHVEYLNSLYESIVYKDLIVRYKIDNQTAFRDLIFYLFSNVSKEFTYNSLGKLIGIKSTSTISTWCSYLENSFLCFTLNRYHPSLKAQLQLPKKIYVIDHMLTKTIGFRFSEDKGRILENIVFMALKRQYNDLFYHKNQKECDFIVRVNHTIIQAIQVCLHFDTEETKQRELQGLIEAMNTYQLNKGFLLTQDMEEELQIDTCSIHIIPIWKWLLTQNPMLWPV